jgi:hypothetical protein
MLQLLAHPCCAKGVIFQQPARLALSHSWFLWLLWLRFAVNSLANVSWTSFEPDVVRLAASQQLHGITTYQRGVLQIESNRTIDFLKIKESLQLCDLLDLDSTNQGEDDFAFDAR